MIDLSRSASKPVLLATAAVLLLLSVAGWWFRNLSAGHDGTAGGDRGVQNNGVPLTAIERSFDPEYLEYKRAFGKDFDTGRKLYLSLPRDMREYRIRQLVTAEAISHEQAFALLMDEPDASSERIEIRKMLFQFMGQRNDARALEFVDRFKLPVEREEALAAFSSRYHPTTDGQVLDLVNWAVARGPEERTGVGEGMGRMLGGLSSLESVRQAMKVGGDWLGGSCAGLLAGRYLAEATPKEALGKLLAEDGIDQHLAEGIFFSRIGSNPDLALKVLNEPWVKEFYRGDLYASIAGRLFAKEPESALQWLDGLPEDPMVHRASSAIEYWIEQDTMQASKRIATLKSPQVRRLATTVMVRVLKAAGDTEAAAQWEQQLGEKPPDKPVIRPGAAIPLQDSPE